MRVECYWNLHKHTFSMRDCSTGRVIAHPTEFMLHDVTFVVQPAGQARVRRERRKNVHAFVRGTLLDMPCGNPALYGWPTYYNPFKWDTFMRLCNEDMAFPYITIGTARYVRGYEVDASPRLIAYGPDGETV